MPRRNPPLIPADMSADVWKRQMKAAAERSVEERFDEWQQLNEAVARMEADGIRRRHPDYDDHQVLLAAVRIRYGDALVQAAWPGDPLMDP